MFRISGRMDKEEGMGGRIVTVAMAITLSLGTLLPLLALPALPGALAGEGTVALKLGGQYCNFYLGDVKKALMKVPGVKGVSFDQSGSTVVVTEDPGKVSAGKLIRTIRGVHGEAWSCDAKKAD